MSNKTLGRTQNDKNAITQMTPINDGKWTIPYSTYMNPDNAIIPILLPNEDNLVELHTKAYHWHIDSWSTLPDRCMSPVFYCGNIPWRILLFPNGNRVRDFVSVYLMVDNEATSDFTVCAAFALAISDPDQPHRYFSSTTYHRFIDEEPDWGFSRFHGNKPLAQGGTSQIPFINKDRVIISVFVRIVQDETGVLWRDLTTYDSRKETGYVGINNQGATCYMNSVLQSLYFTNSFRRAVYQIPTESDDPTKCVALALQRCFYQLQYSEEPVDTTELAKSFGWDFRNAFIQHDVQEFNRMLQDNLELKAKDTPAGGVIKHLFMGKMKNRIKCINVDYESSRTEDFCDIQLNVRGCKNLHESFLKYVNTELLEGDNKYDAKHFGLQDARKETLFETFPPVLLLQLKRFEYDIHLQSRIKINDYHEFPETIDLAPFVEASREPCVYVLHGVLVHGGDPDVGHYCALIKPEKDSKWYRFDDDKVTLATRREVFECNFGEDPLRSTKYIPTAHDHDPAVVAAKACTNAYMLVYIRQNMLDEVLAPIHDDEIPRHLKRNDHKTTRPSAKI